MATIGTVLDLIRSGCATTRAELIQQTGLSRSTLGTRLNTLREMNLIRDDAGHDSTGGRPPTHICIDDNYGLLAIAVAGAHHVHIGLATLTGHIIAKTTKPSHIENGAAEFIASLVTQFDALLHQSGYMRYHVAGIGIGLPGPVEFETGRVIEPPIMPGWDGYPIAETLGESFNCPILIDNEVNLMALGEQRTAKPEVRELFFIKLATGIGAGVVINGQLQRGFHGAAGDIGHLAMTSPYEEQRSIRCRCGNLGCLEAYASGWALIRKLHDQGRSVNQVADIIDLANHKDPIALAALDQAEELIGQAVSHAVSLLNPSLVVFGGSLADAWPAGIKRSSTIVRDRSPTLATRGLRIEQSQLGAQAGLIGAMHLIGEYLLSPARIDRHLSAKEVDIAS